MRIIPLESFQGDFSPDLATPGPIVCHAERDVLDGIPESAASFIDLFADLLVVPSAASAQAAVRTVKDTPVTVIPPAFPDVTPFIEGNRPLKVGVIGARVKRSDPIVGAVFRVFGGNWYGTDDHWIKAFSGNRLDRSLATLYVAVIPSVEPYSYGAINHEALNAMSAGCLVLAELFPGISDVLSPVEDCLTWKGESELEDLLRLARDRGEGSYANVMKAGHERAKNWGRDEWTKRVRSEVLRLC